MANASTKESDSDLPRLQKVLATAGVGSRRACETLIVEGKVSVNGKVIRELGTKVNPVTDDIRVSGEPIFTADKPKPQYIALNKPLGYTSTVTDPNAHHTVMELVTQVPGRLYPVGRLDVDSEGLLLLTNDGDFANRLTHPRYHVPKIYEVRVKNFMERETARKLAEGIELHDGMTAPAEMRFLDYDSNTQTTRLQITLYEGRNRQVRRMMEAVGHPVRSLVRVQFGNIKIGLLNPGTWRKLSPEEVEGLLALAKATPTPPKSKRISPIPLRRPEPAPRKPEEERSPLPERPSRRPEGKPDERPRPGSASASRPPRRPAPRPNVVNDATVRPPRPADSRPPSRPRVKGPGESEAVQPFIPPRPPRPPGKIKTPRPPKPSPPRYRRPDKRGDGT